LIYKDIFLGKVLSFGFGIKNSGIASVCFSFVDCERGKATSDVVKISPTLRSPQDLKMKVIG
jgi:hypothetical protein